MCDITKTDLKEQNALRVAPAMTLPPWATFCVHGTPSFIFKAPREILATGLSHEEAKALVALWSAKAESRGHKGGFGSMNFGVQREAIASTLLTKATAQEGDFVIWSFFEPTERENVTVERFYWGVVEEICGGKVVARTALNNERMVCPVGTVLIPSGEFANASFAKAALDAGWREVRYFDIGTVARLTAPHRRITRWTAPDEVFIDFLDRNDDNALQVYLKRLAA